MKYAALFFLLMLGVSDAYACAVLESASPKVGSTLEAAPAAVTLTFSGKIYVKSSYMQVTDAEGKQVSAGAPYRAGDDTTMAIKLSPLAAGKYKVSWSVLCDCGSLTPGDYSFRLR